VAGKRIAAACGEQLKRYSLELGGKSAAIILDDADLDATLARLLPATINNNGQVCVNQTRILAPEGRYDEIVEAFTEGYRALTIGDPMDMATEVGPLIHSGHRDRVEGYIRAGHDEGARLTVGGSRPDGFDRGFYVEPTVFAGVRNDMRIAQEEIFGPVVVIIPFDGEDEAVRLANDVRYGLAAGIWTGDVGRAHRVAHALDAGSIWVNHYGVYPSEAPFGGYKESGTGHDLGLESLDEYTEVKNVHVNIGTETFDWYA
jgi:betaine-aldehyde dehydrogenase